MHSRFILPVSVLALSCLFLVRPSAEISSEGNDPVTTKKEGVQTFGARGDGKTDDTEAIQKNVNRGGSVHFPGGTYRITKTIEIDLAKVGFVSLVSDGTATIVMEGKGPAFRFVGTHNGTADPGSLKPNVWEKQRSPRVRDLVITGTHEQADGIQAKGTMKLTVTGVVLRKLRHGIHLVERNRNVIISDCHVYENSGIGIFYDNVNLHQSNVIGCHVSYNLQGGIVVRGGQMRNIHIGTCDIEGNHAEKGEPTANVVLDAGDGSIGEATIVGCTIQHTHNAPNSANVRINAKSTPSRGTEELRHGNFTIADNVLSDVQINVDVQNARGVTITGNTMWQGFTHDVIVRNCANVVIANNVHDRNPRYHLGSNGEAKCGLVFIDCRDCTLNGNHVTAASAGVAIRMEKCDRFNVTNCSILDSPGVGLLMKDVTNSRVSDCLIHSKLPQDKNVTSLRVMGGSGNLIVDNLLGDVVNVDEKSAKLQGNTTRK